MTSIPKSTVSDWIQEENLSNGENDFPINKQDMEGLGTNLNESLSESNDSPDRNQTDFGQFYLKNSNPINETNENRQNRTEMYHQTLSPAMIELEKLKIQLQHEREMRKMDIELDELEIRKQEISIKERTLNFEAEKLSRTCDEFREKVIEIARFINAKGQESEWEYDEICDLCERTDHIRQILLPVIERNGL